MPRRPGGRTIPSADCFAVVTGTSSGIGAAVAARLVDEGWTVVGVARRVASIDGSGYRHITLDLSNTADAVRVLDAEVGGALRSRPWTRVGLVNNAAAGGSLGPLERIDAQTLQSMMATNVVVPMHLMGLFVERTPPTAALRIVNLSSGAAVRPFPGLSAYGATKAALRMAGMVLGTELASPLRNTPAPDDVAILSYEPGVVDTPMQTGARETSAEQFPWVGLFHDFAAGGVIVPPERPAAEIVEFLESPRQSHFTESRLGSRT
jgi:benzil reductase ((S)-benzoin forming)